MTSLRLQEIVRLKRQGEALDEAAISDFVAGVTSGEISDDEIAAFTKAVFDKGMNAAEQRALTFETAASGEILDWSAAGLSGPAVDKHSTGGVGDKVSLILAPLVGACGAHVPMISGRGLGHSGGTMDKMEAIPGYDAVPTLERFQDIVREVGCSIIGQTAQLAPADKRIYAVRDVTDTVASLPLITASILSKKLAAGLDFLAMDVKFGSGAFMESADEARALAANIVTIAAEAGMPTTALLTDMNQVLGHTAGNALEVREAVDFLSGREREPRLEDCTLALAAQMLIGTGLADDEAAAREAASAALDEGRAAEVFARMVAAHGGPADLIEKPDKYLAAAPVVQPLIPEGEGFLSAMDVRAVGMAVVHLGGGRKRVEDVIDPAVGLSAVAGIGDKVGGGAPLAIIHARDPASAEAAARELLAAVSLSDEPTRPGDLVREVIRSEDQK